MRFLTSFSLEVFVYGFHIQHISNWPGHMWLIGQHVSRVFSLSLDLEQSLAPFSQAGKSRTRNSSCPSRARSQRGSHCKVCGHWEANQASFLHMWTKLPLLSLHWRVQFFMTGDKPYNQTFQVTLVQSLGRKDPLEEEMATHSSILAWRIPWTEEPRALQSLGLQRGDIACMQAL